MLGLLANLDRGGTGFTERLRILKNVICRFAKGCGLHRGNRLALLTPLQTPRSRGPDILNQRYLRALDMTR